MKPKVAVITVVGLVAAALIYWFGFRDQAAPPKAVAVSRKVELQKPAAHPEEIPTAEPRPKGTPPLTFETDPDGPLKLEGQVLDERDQPVAGARVRISTRPSRTAETEPDGSFSFDKLLGRTYSVSARAGDKLGGPVTTKLLATAEPVVIRLRPGVALTVRVSDAVTKKPIAGASVTLLDGEETNESTDGEGKAVFRGVDHGWTRAMASAPTYGRAVASKMLGKSDSATTLELALKSGAALSGRVVDESGNGLPGVRVWAVDAASGWGQGGSELSAVTSSGDGAYTIAALSAGSYVIRAKNETHVPASTPPITVTGESATAGVQIVMKSAAELSGVVVGVEGQPIPYATVKLSSREWSRDMVHREAAADAKGHFELHALPRAALKVRAESEDAASKVVDVDLAATPIKKDLKLVLDQSGMISGIVVDGAGEPIAEAEVTAYPDFLSGKRTNDDFVLAQGAAATTDGGGRFALRGLETGQFRLQASRSSGGQTARGSNEGQVANTGDKDVKLVLPAPGGVKGNVQVEGGKAPPLASVSVDWEHRVTIRDGTFELTDLVPGKYDLRVIGSDFAEKIVRDIEIKAGKTTDAGTVIVRPGRKISGRVVDSKGQGIEGARILYGKFLMGDGKQTGTDDEDNAAQFGVRQTSTDPSGGFVISGATRGGGSIVAEHADRGRSLAQKLPPGGDDIVDLTLTLRGYGSIAGTVTRNGEPVAGATVSIAAIGSSGLTSFVQAGGDGTYVVDKVAEGLVGLSASKGMMATEAASRRVTVIAGQRVDGSIALPVGPASLAVTIVPKPGATVNAARVFLFRGMVAVTTADLLVDAFYANQGIEGATGATELAMTGAAGMMFWLGADQPTFKELVAGLYSACAIPVTGSIGDPQLMQRIMRNLDKLEVICQSTTVTATPTPQTMTIAVSTMRPLPDDE